MCFADRPDERGSFVKSFQSSVFTDLGIENHFVETFYTRSHANVIRGMHFQLPPGDGAKLVYCLQGEILDIALDLRVDSATFGQYCTFRLSGEDATAAYIPAGMAHGFCVLNGPALMMYHVTSEYHPSLDTGIRWDSFGFEWPCSSPVISNRDADLPLLADFESPFCLKRKLHAVNSTFARRRSSRAGWAAAR
jgi:dTDP-4-dehydrorhamnose 3,5-epimerase